MKLYPVLSRFCSLLLVASLVLPRGLAQEQKIDIIFTDQDYYSHTWETFSQLPAANDTIDFAAPAYSILNAAVFFATNHARRQEGLPALRFSPALRDMAEQHARAMATYDFVSHVNRRQRQFSTMEKRSQHFEANASAENVASTFLYRYEEDTYYYRVWESESYAWYNDEGERLLRHTYLSFAQKLVQNWMDSPGHRVNILELTHKSLGCAVALSSRELNSGRIPLAYGAQNFSRK